LGLDGLRSLVWTGFEPNQKTRMVIDHCQRLSEKYWAASSRNGENVIQ
jgi:hypothetical protein